MAAIPLPADDTTSCRSLGGTPVINVEIRALITPASSTTYTVRRTRSGRPPRRSVASDLARRAGARLVTVDKQARRRTPTSRRRR